MKSIYTFPRNRGCSLPAPPFRFCERGRLGIAGQLRGKGGDRSEAGSEENTWGLRARDHAGSQSKPAPGALAPVKPRSRKDGEASCLL